MSSAVPSPSAPDRVVALVPMRHHSERVPGKNLRPFGGRPLYRHVVETLLAVPRVAEIVIDTDSDAITADAEAVYGDRVRVVRRPPHLRDGATPMNEVLRHTVTQAPAALYLQTHSTNPLLRPATVDAALDALAAAPEHDSLFGVTALHARLWSPDGRPLNHDPERLLRTQDLPPVLLENSNLYLFTGDVLRRRGNRVGASPLLFRIGQEEAWDLDEESDFLVAEALYALRRQEVAA